MTESFHWFVEYLVPYLNFIIFLCILVFFARKPISQLVVKRKMEFDSHFKSANESLLHVKQQFEELQNRNRLLESEIAQMKERAIQDAQNEANRIIEDGKRLAQQILEDAKRMQKAEFYHAQKELENQVLNLVKSTLIKKFENEFDEAKDQKFVGDRLKEMSALNKTSLVGG